MSKTKRLLAIIMCLALALSIAPLTMFARAEDPTNHPINITSYTELAKIGVDPNYPSADTSTDTYTYTIANNLTFSDDEKKEALSKYLGDDSDKLANALTTLGLDGYTYNTASVTTGDDISSSVYYVLDEGHYKITSDTTAIEGTTYYVQGEQKGKTAILNDASNVATLCTAYNITQFEFTPIESFDCTIVGDVDGNGTAPVLSDLKIDVTATAGDTKIVAGIIGTCLGEVSNITADNSCSINVDATAANAAVVYAGTFAGIGNGWAGTGTFTSLKSSAVITVNNKLYATTTTKDADDKDVTTTSATHIGGIVGYGLFATINKSTFNGAIVFNGPTLNATDSTELSNVNTKAVLNIGGIYGSGYSSLGSGDNANTSNPTISSSFIGGSGIAIGKLAASDNDYSALELKAADKCGTALTEVTDATLDSLKSTNFNTMSGTIAAATSDGKYQLVTVNDTVKTCFIRSICSHTNYDEIAAKAATCTEDGNVAAKKCKDCGNYFTDDGVISSAEFTIKATGHGTITKTDAKEANCAATGDEALGNKVYYTCDKCGDSIKYKDENCTQKYAENEWVIQPEHSWSAWTETEAPTYDKVGTKQRTCSSCQKVETAEVAKLTPEVKLASSTNGNTISGSLLITNKPTSKNGLSVDAVKNYLADPGYGKVYVFDNLADGNILKTGSTVMIEGYPESKITIVVPSDVDGNGVVSSMDYVLIKNHMLASKGRKASSYLITDSAKKTAADADQNNTISSKDYVVVKNIMLGKTK